MWVLFFLYDNALATLGRDSFLQLPACPDGHGSSQLRSEQRIKRLGQDAADVVVVVNQQALEKGKVELSPQWPGCLLVGRHAVTDPCQCALDVALGPSEVALDLGQAAFGAVDLPRQPFLLALEQIKRHGIGIVRVKQLLAFGKQADQPTLLHPPFVLAVKPQHRQFFFEEGPDRRQLVRRKLHGRVVAGNGVLNLLDAQRPELAVGPFLLTADADEVGVDAAAAFGVADDQPAAALAAVDRALEVVRMVAVPLAGQVLGRQ
ncbi:MAG TPA: hypothetical protein VGP17_06560 [Solirubrobacteraceae bacterium]|nr:hypothetical protein [Solirubrobacteraceae bacterium]